VEVELVEGEENCKREEKRRKYVEDGQILVDVVPYHSLLWRCRKVEVG
jgi:hypothetical protein